VGDLLNREDPTKLRGLLEVAKVPNHPMREEALTDLELFVGENYASDWPKWQKAVDDYIAKQRAASAP